MKTICVAIALTFVTAAAASAQSVEIGPGGVRFGVHPPPPPEVRRYDRRWDRGYRVREREFGRCRTIVTRRETPRGDIMTRRVKKCR